MTILAIDPGSERSAYVALYEGKPYDHAIIPNADMLAHVHRACGDRTGEAFMFGIHAVVIERVEGFGMPVGVEVFETVYWSGRFAEAAHPLPVHRIGRKAVKLHLCGSARATDSNIRQALIDRYGPGKAAAIGTKKAPGPLHGIANDVWAALALAVTYQDQQEGT